MWCREGNQLHFMSPNSKNTSGITTEGELLSLQVEGTVAVKSERGLTVYSVSGEEIGQVCFDAFLFSLSPPLSVTANRLCLVMRTYKYC